MSEHVIDKIRAILRKADENTNASSAEREVAMHMANKLLLKHGLAMEDIGEIADDDTSAGRMFERTREFETDSSDSWRGTLLHRLSRIYFCKAYYVTVWMGEDASSKQSGRRWILVGRKSNADTCRAMYEFIAPQIQRELDVELASIVRTSSPHLQQQARHARTYAEQAAWVSTNHAAAVGECTDEELAEIGRQRLSGKSGDQAVKDIQALCGIESFHYAKKVRAFIKRGDIARAPIADMGVFRRSFLEAAVQRVASRVSKLMREDVNDLGDAGTALVKDEKADLNRFMDELGLRLSSHASNRQVDEEGLVAGDAAGRRADISGHSKVSSVGPRSLGAGS